MDQGQLQNWMALFSAAVFLGTEVVDGVKTLARKQLSDEEYAALELACQADVEESARNAGIDPEPDTPITSS